MTTKSWWDTVDALASCAAGPLVLANPELREVIDRWIESENIWLARGGDPASGGYRERTDADLLFRCCLRRADERDFFIRKPIGWSLGSYAKVAPDAVEHLLAQHGRELSGLSQREAELGVAIGRGIGHPPGPTGGAGA